MSERKLNRREFFKRSVVGAVGAVLAVVRVPASAASPSKTNNSIRLTGRVVENSTVYKEAPILRQRVAAGELPPLQQRLPQTPLVVSGKDIGAYGHIIRMIHKSENGFISNYDLNAERYLHYSDQQMGLIEPNIFESWQVSQDGKTWTFNLRSGMKWSDGSPLTTEDVRFWWESVINNPSLGYSVDWQFRFGGTKMVVEIMDSLTFKFTFAAPFGNFAMHLTRFLPFGGILLPSAYLKQFHIEYANPVTLAQLIQQYNFTNWIELFTFIMSQGVIWNGSVESITIPVLNPWRIISNPQAGQFFWERNPYYWKVDPSNNQLPYIDNLRYDYVSDDTEVKSWLAQGKIDILGQHDVSIANFTFYQANQTAGNYSIGDYRSCMSDRYVLLPQHYIEGDTVLTEIVNHPNFVKALSLSVNRAEINQMVFGGKATMGQLSVMPDSRYYKATYATAWAQYNQTQANGLLDAMGLNRRDSSGYRLRSDGKRLTFIIEHCGERIGPITTQLANMVAGYWRMVGIDSACVLDDEGTYNVNMQNCQVHCGMWEADRCTDLLWPIEPYQFIPVGSATQVTPCAAWSTWYLADDRSNMNLIVPPEAIKTLYGYFDLMTATLDENARVSFGRQILDKLADSPLAIGLIVECPAPLLLHKDLGNLPPTKALIGWDTYGLSTYHPETFYYMEKMYLPQVTR